MKTLYIYLALPLLATVLSLPARAAAQDCGVPVSCCPPTKKICVSEPKKNTKVVYNSVCKDYCLPKCALCSSHGCGSCDSCCNGECGKARTRRVLIKRTVPDCDTTQCVVKEVLCESACQAPCSTIIIQGQPTMGGPAMEQAPMPGPKK